MKPLSLHTSITSAASVTGIPGGWRLSLPAGSGGAYRLAQLDDYRRLPRSQFPWRPPLRLSVQMRASHAVIPGTWGIGLWNDPFSASLGMGGGERSLPALPQCAWFFFASPPNHLTVYDDQPGNGALAGVITGQPGRIPAKLLGLPVLPLGLLGGWLPSLGRAARRCARDWLAQATQALDLDATAWHTYTIDWQTSGVHLYVDDDLALNTPLSPSAPLGLVLWVDNQFAAWMPQGRIRAGTLPNPDPVWIEARQLSIESTGQAFTAPEIN